jgi:hypothetical protein
MTSRCDTCGHGFSFSLIHNGFNDSSYAYCDRCGMTALLDGWSQHIPDGVGTLPPERIPARVEPYLAPCTCGGRFTAKASPRCAHCATELSADSMTHDIESQSTGTQKGWRWQRSWASLYAIIVDGRVMRDPWRSR